MTAKKKSMPKTDDKKSLRTPDIETVAEKPQVSQEKRRVFVAIMVLLPFLLLLLFEALLDLFNYGGNTDLFIQAPAEVSQYRMINRNVGRRYFFMQSTLPTPQKDLVLKKKPANGYRIFVMGGSTTAGFPFGNNVMFSRILHFRLADAFPDRTIEVINVGMSAINSYTVLDFMDEVLANDADAILIYAGHNEFYGAMGVASMESLGRNRGVVKAYLKMERFRTFLLVRDVVGRLRRMSGKTKTGNRQDLETATLMERIVSDTVIPYKSRIYELGKQQFEANLREIIEKAQKAGVSVITSELISNIKDVKPFESVQLDQLPAASTVFEYAEDLQKQEKYDDARAAYYRAKDLDAVRFRAAEEFNEIIHNVSDKLHVPVVPMKRCFEVNSPNGLIGDNLTVDHLHPNIQGYFIMADAFFDCMREHHFIADSWNADLIKSSEDYCRNWGITRLDTLAAEISIRYLKGSWPFQPKSARNCTLDNYHPSSIEESIAYEILTREDVSLEIGHVNLASYYIDRKDYESAYHEYKALIYIVPYEAIFYEKAAELLMKLDRYDEALATLLESLKFDDNFYANKWCGQIYLKNGDPNRAIAYLEKAVKQQQFDVQLLFNLSRVYLDLNNRPMARKYYEKLKRIDRNSDYTKYLKRSLEAPAD